MKMMAKNVLSWSLFSFSITNNAKGIFQTRMEKLVMEITKERYCWNKPRCFPEMPKDVVFMVTVNGSL